MRYGASDTNRSRATPIMKYVRCSCDFYQIAELYPYALRPSSSSMVDTASHLHQDAPKLYMSS